LSSENEAVIGKVIAPHGVDGRVKVYPFSDFPERVHYLEDVHLELETERKKYIVEKTSIHGRFWLIKLQGIDTRVQAEKLRESNIVIPLQERVSLPEDAYYHDQLIGLEVYSTDGELLGHITDVVSNGGHDQLLLKRTGQEKKESFIPAVKEFVREIDLSAGIMIVNLPEGLLDL